MGGWDDQVDGAAADEEEDDALTALAVTDYY